MREERERLGLSQAAFGQIGGVKANAQGKYESGERHADTAYLEAIAQAGVDTTYVITGERRPLSSDALSSEEADVLHHFREMSEVDRGVVKRLAHALAKSSGKD